jgi:MFS family permease
MSGPRFLFVVSLAASLLMVGVGMIVALLPQRILDFSGSLTNVGYVASVFALSYLIVQVPIGILADRLGAKPFLVLGYALCCVSGIVFFFAGSSESIFLGRFIQGAGEAPVWALGPALLSLAYPHAKGKVIGIYNASIHTGLTIGPLLGILLFPTGAGNLPFVLFAALCLSGGVTVLLFLPRAPATSRPVVGQTPTLRQMAKLLKTPGSLLTLAGVLLYGAGYGIFISVLPASQTLSKGFDNLSIGVFFALFYVAISVSQLIVGPLSDRHGRHAYMISGFIVAAIGFATFVWFPYPWTYVPLTLASFGLGVFCVSSMAYLNECVPESLNSTISGSYYLSWGLGYFLGPLAVGWLGEMVHPQVGYYFLALLIAAQAGTMCLCRTTNSRKELDAE